MRRLWVVTLVLAALGVAVLSFIGHGQIESARFARREALRAQAAAYNSQVVECNINLERLTKFIQIEEAEALQRHNVNTILGTEQQPRLAEGPRAKFTWPEAVEAAQRNTFRKMEEVEQKKEVLVRLRDDCLKEASTL